MQNSPANSLQLKVPLYCAAIVFACDAYIRTAEENAEIRLKAYWDRNQITDTVTTTVKKTSGFWWWKKTWAEDITVPISDDAKARLQDNLNHGASLLAPRIPLKIHQLRALAAHFKPAQQIDVTGEELALIAEYLAPSEAFAGGGIRQRI